VSLSLLAARIRRDALEIAHLTTSRTAQTIAQSIALEAQAFDGLDLDTPVCRCPVCEGRPDAVEYECARDTNACQSAVDDAEYFVGEAMGRESPDGVATIGPEYVERVLEQLRQDAAEVMAETCDTARDHVADERARARLADVFSDARLASMTGTR